MNKHEEQFKLSAEEFESLQTLEKLREEEMRRRKEFESAENESLKVWFDKVFEAHNYTPNHDEHVYFADAETGAVMRDLEAEREIAFANDLSKQVAEMVDAHNGTLPGSIH